MYVIDDTINTAVVNSLFGDGAAAAVISAKSLGSCVELGPKILGFNSHIIPGAIESMRIELQKNKYAFYLDKQIPYVLGLHVKTPVDKILNKFRRAKRDIRHWVIHSGGRKVIDSIKYALDLTEHDVRHTSAILKQFGNLSSGAFLFSHQRLLEENSVESGDLVMMMTMGPGATIECCLGEF